MDLFNDCMTLDNNTNNLECSKSKKKKRLRCAKWVFYGTMDELIINPDREPK